MESVEHLGQYVYEMTNAKVQQMRAERGLGQTALVAPPLEEITEEVGLVDEEDIEEGFEAEEEE